MAKGYVFHIRNAHPGDMKAALVTLEMYPNLKTIAEIVITAESLGFMLQDRKRLEALVTARELGIIEPNCYRLTSMGHILLRLADYHPELFPDLVHALQYTLWNPIQPESFCFSWTYRKFCELLWHQREVEVHDRRLWASIVEAHAKQCFNKDNIALSPKSIGGALLWLKRLSPPVIIDDKEIFRRRSFCPPELFILAVDFVYREARIDYGVNLLLTETHKEAICKMCLLEPDSFEKVLSYAIAQFGYLEKGIGGGWGRFLVLHRAPQWEDFLP